MKRISPFCLILLVLAACHHPGPDPGKVSPQPTTEAQNDRDEGPPMMEKGVSHVPVLLTPVEKDGLRKAVDGTPVSKDSSISHIHADVQNGHLVFVPEQSQDPTHVPSDAPRISVSGRNPRTVAVVATPAAKQLLEQRTGNAQ